MKESVKVRLANLKILMMQRFVPLQMQALVTSMKEETVLKVT